MARGCTILFLFGLTLTGCSSGEAGSSIDFTGEQVLIPGFEFDSGFLPESSPVQLAARASSSGQISVSAQGLVNPNLQPVVGSGRLSLEGALQFSIDASIDVAGQQFEGPIAEESYVIAPASTNFDPFLLDQGVEVAADLPPVELVRAPVPSIPGATVIVGVASGTLQARFEGRCATDNGSEAEYQGEVTVFGEVELEGSVEVSLGFVEDSFGPFRIRVPVPEVSTPMDLGRFDLSSRERLPPQLCANLGGDGGVSPDGSVPSDGGIRTDGNTSGGCSASNCDGCCAGDRCLAGTEANACGSSGVACDDCGERRCERFGGGMTCAAPCATTCDGCCMGETCMDGVNNGACGTLGRACRTCIAGTACTLGSCVSTSCSDTCDGCCEGDTCRRGDSGAACGSDGLQCLACERGFECADSACAPDPRATWRVEVLAARVSAVDHTGERYDTFEPPDVFVTASLGGIMGSTPFVNNTTTPSWAGDDAIILRGVPTDAFDSRVFFTLTDDDSLSSDDLIAQCFISIGPENSSPRFFGCPATSMTTEASIQLRVVAE
ncbi:MAG: hypothetical protein AAF938_13510 [Myxococcota bacterium]